MSEWNGRKENFQGTKNLVIYDETERQIKLPPRFVVYVKGGISLYSIKEKIDCS